MNGTDATTGKPLDGLAHLMQSIRDILCTLVGTRVCRRTYGSQLMALIDGPTNKSTILDMAAATAGALAEWEPRIAVSQVQVTFVGQGCVSMNILGTYLPDGSAVNLPITVSQ